ncbi:hypothetical protein RDI58_015473 [Solanum bulbocastanum]|uniref:Uncharacterized protein n=1 Tax=Solanum bulbocastanum TaxID=147425 RepID=A0AAN8TEE4_SOLBU
MFTFSMNLNLEVVQ